MFGVVWLVQFLQIWEHVTFDTHFKKMFLKLIYSTNETQFS